MLISNYYGGRWILDDDGNRMYGENAPADLSLEQLQPGDIVVLGRAKSGGERILWFAVYQGGGGFINSAFYQGFTSYNGGNGTVLRAKLAFGDKIGVRLRQERPGLLGRVYLLKLVAIQNSWPRPLFAVKPGTISSR